MLANTLQKIKSRADHHSDLLHIGLEAIVFGAFLVTAFLLGRSSIAGSSNALQPIVVLEPKDSTYDTYYKNYGTPTKTTTTSLSKNSSGGGSAQQQSLGSFGASVNGTKYYPKGCSGLNRIKAENLIWFTSKEEAESAGYSAATNC